MIRIVIARGMYPISSSGDHNVVLELYRDFWVEDVGPIRDIRFKSLSQI